MGIFYWDCAHMHAATPPPTILNPFQPRRFRVVLMPCLCSPATDPVVGSGV